MATKIAKLEYLTDAQCVRFNDYGSITWHVFKNEADALRWKLKLVEWNGNLRGVNSTMFFNARAGALIYSLEDAETRVFRRIDELRECEDFCGGEEWP